MVTETIIDATKSIADKALTERFHLYFTEEQFKSVFLRLLKAYSTLLQNNYLRRAVKPKRNKQCF